MQHNSDWLWLGCDVLHYRQRKAAAVITAVADVLAGEHRAGVATNSFIAAFQRYRQFSSTTQNVLAAEPYAYYWGRLAYELLQQNLRPEQAPVGLAAYYCSQTGLTPQAALDRHLQDFSRLMLAAACLDDVDLELEQPLHTTAPFAIPGSPLSYDRPADIVVAGVQNGELCAHDLRARRISATSYPVSQCDGCRVRLQPAVFNVLASGITRELASFDHALQSHNRANIEAALSLLRAIDGDSFDQIATTLRVIATRPAAQPGVLTNVSHCDLPGAISIYAYPHPHELANIILHEFLHNRLFALEEQAHFLKTEIDSADNGELYSPWRNGYRPPHGVLHAVFVFTGIGRYWTKVIHHGDTPQPIRELAKARLIHGLLQVRIGLAELRRFSGFTGAGEAVMHALDGEHHALWQAARDIGIDPDFPLFRFAPGDAFGSQELDYTVQDSVTRHVQNYARAEHVDMLNNLIASPH